MRAPDWATAFSATSSAAACCCTWSTAPASTPARLTRRCARELEAYGEGLADKPEIVALTKIDAMTVEDIKQQAARLKRAAKKTPLLLSAQSRKGAPEALRALLKVIDDAGGSSMMRRRDGERAWQP